MAPVKWAKVVGGKRPLEPVKRDVITGHAQPGVVDQTVAPCSASILAASKQCPNWHR